MTLLPIHATIATYRLEAASIHRCHELSSGRAAAALLPEVYSHPGSDLDYQRGCILFKKVDCLARSARCKIKISPKISCMTASSCWVSEAPCGSTRPMIDEYRIHSPRWWTSSVTWTKRHHSQMTQMMNSANVPFPLLFMPKQAIISAHYIELNFSLLILWNQCYCANYKGVDHGEESEYVLTPLKCHILSFKTVVG